MNNSFRKITVYFLKPWTVAILINLVWAFSYPVSKLVLQNISAPQLTFIRLFISSLFFVPFLKPQDFKQHWTFGKWSALLGMGVLGIMGASALQYLGTSLTLAANVSLIISLEPILILFLGMFFFHEKISRRGLLGIFFAVLGVLLVTVDAKSLSFFKGQYFWGNLIILLSVFCYGAYTLLGKYLSPTTSTNALTALPFIIGTLSMIPLFPFEISKLFRANATSWNFPMLAQIFFLVGPATILGYFIWNWLITQMPAGQLSFSLYVQPLSGAFFSWYLLDEILSPFFAIGAVGIISGLVLIYYPNQSSCGSQ